MSDRETHLDENGFVVLDDPDGIRAQEVANCALCDSDGYRNGSTVCHHQQHSSPEVRAAAREAVRVALAKDGGR